MKKINYLTTILILIAALNVNANVVTLCNVPGRAGQYTNFADAMDAVNPYDTIYVSGSHDPYFGDVTKDHITIIGTGFHPNKQEPNVSTFGSIEINNNLTLIGLSVDGVRPGSHTNITGELKIINCLIGGVSGISDVGAGNNSFPITILNSVITEAITCNDGSYKTFDIRNSIIHGSIVASGFENLYFLNNIFYGSGSLLVTDVHGLNGPDNVIVSNIFYGISPSLSGVTTIEGNLQLDYNCAWPSTLDFSFHNDGHNTVADPVFVGASQPPLVFNLASDYHLTPFLSPFFLGGADNTDLGVYGGPSQYGGFTMTGEPPIPQIRFMSVPASASSGDVIQVHFSSGANH